jgi:uncharacterized protein YprB with RNaseH-like and TPR domain
VLRNTFCHVPGIGEKTERGLWARGVLSWNDVLRMPPDLLSQKNHYFLRNRLMESVEQIEEGNPDYFAETLPSSQHWRLFPEFRSAAAYLDIETTGMAGPGDHITTIAMYDGQNVFHYVKDHNLHEFRDDIAPYKMVVTYNGKCFDLPVIERSLGIRMPRAHIDLRFVLQSLGYRGGLKGCEKQLGLDRGDLDGVDGYFAVMLWHDYKSNRNTKALETLLAYNILDAVNLESLMVTAYNLKLKDTPFEMSHRIPQAPAVENPFSAHRPTVNRLMSLREYHYL